ncbi:unnamed protein product, partial [Effrenium voratum]
RKRSNKNHLTVKYTDGGPVIKSPTAAESEDAIREEPQPRKRPTFRQVATAVCGNVKFKKQKKAGPLDVAQMELSFHRTVSKSSVCTLAARLRKSLPKFGEIQFQSGLMTRYCIVGPDTQPQKFVDLIIRSAGVWDLEAPRLLLSIVGGAGEMNLDPAVEAHFCEGLVGAAKQTHGWVITGGTNSGVMDLVGRAMHRHDARRTVPCIGITPFGALKDCWRSSLDSPEAGPDCGVVEAPLTKNDSDEMPSLQEHHTHVVLVDAGKRRQEAFGTEVDMREALERYVATSTMFRKRSRSCCLSRGTGSGGLDAADIPTSPSFVHRERVLRVMIVVNGGPVSFTLMDKAIQNGCPVVVCNNSGRAADFIASLKLGQLTDYEEAWKKHMTAPPDVKSGLRGVRCGVEALQRIVASSCVTVYTTNDRLEDVILEAVRQQVLAQDLSDEELETSLERLLELAVQWGCEKHYVTIARRMVATCGFSKVARFILHNFCNDWSEKEIETAPLMRWLLATYGDSLKRFPLTELSPPGIRWQKAEMQLQPAEVSSLAHLFIWLAENKAPESVTDVLWQCLDYPAHGALAATSVCRQAAERYQAQGSYGETMVGHLLMKRADRFEGMAVRLLSGLDRVDPLEYVFRRSWRWGNHHLISLAHHLECKEFVSQHFYNSAVDLLWVTPTPFAVFAFDKDEHRRQANKVTEPYYEVVWRFSGERRRQLSLRDLFSIPRIKALTHGGSRVTFVLLYSYYVLFASGVEAMLMSLLLLIWGISLGLIEALQLQAKGSVGQYMNIWNALDVCLIFTLLFGISLWWILVPWALSEQMVNSMHALNLLPCYVRLLQIFELSEYFGTLLFTVFGMAQDTTQFLVLLGIISLGFSCSLTPILYPSQSARWSQGVTWGFWAIFGDVELQDTDPNLPWSLKICVSFLQYLLSLASNVLLVNLLIAMLNDTYVANKDSSKREWAFNRVDAVLEFASPEAHILPPPFDILVSLRALCGRAKPVSKKGEDNFCTVTGVVPLGPHEVEISIEVKGGSIQAAESSLLAWVDQDKEVTVMPEEAMTVDRKCNQAVLVFRDVVLSKALRFTFGGKGSGYETVRVYLDQDSWTRALTRMEQRHISFLQQEVLMQEADEPVEQRNEAIVNETNQKMSVAVDEIRNLSKCVADLTEQMRLQVQRNSSLEGEIRELRVALDGKSA